MKRHWIISLIAAWLLLTLASCQPDNPLPEEGKTLVLGHAGMGVSSAYAMNSLESLLRCLSEGRDGTELDVQMTSDHVLVAYHPSDLSENTTLQGPVSQYTWAEISETYHLDIPHLPYKIIRLDDLFNTLGKDDRHVFSFDCKFFGSTDTQAFAEELTQLVENHSLYDRIFVESGDIAFLEHTKKLQERLLTFYYHNASYELDYSFDLVQEHGLDGISVDNKYITTEQVAKADGLGIRIMIWNLQTAKSRKNALEKHPFAVQVD